MESHATTSEEEVIRHLLATTCQALHDKNLDAWTAHFAADVVVCDLAPPLARRGIDPASIEAWFQTWDGAIGYKLHDLQVTAGETVAFAARLAHMTGTKTSGEKVDLWYRTTDCLEKREGRWLVVHRHESVPFYMDGSYRAAIDLKP